MRRALGTAVFSGMMGVTLFGIVMTPVFFYTIDRLGSARLLSSPPVHRAGGVALDVLRLGFLVRPLQAGAARLMAHARPGNAERAQSTRAARPNTVSPADIAATTRPGHDTSSGNGTPDDD
jgi:multidrug efflux pump